jgi:ABC-type Na+ efflux pump permease subunit
VRLLRTFLDNTLEISIAVFRAVALIAAVSLPAVIVAGIWQDGRDLAQWLATVAALVAFGTGFGVLGFYVFGNEEWRRGKTDDSGAEVRHD